MWRASGGRTITALGLILTLAACGGHGAADEASDGSLLEATTDAGADAAGPEPPDASGAPDASDFPPDAGVPPRPPCQPTAGGPLWILEGEPIRATVSCATGQKLSGEELTLSPLPAGARWDPARSELQWTPGSDQAAVYLIDLTANGETGQLKIGVADRFDAAGNAPIADKLAYTEEYGLPVLFLDWSVQPVHDGYSPATVTYRGHVYEAEAKLHGSASLAFPKNSYTLKFKKTDPFVEPVFAGGMRRTKIVVVTTFSDNSYVRQRLAHDLWNRLDESHFKLRTYSAVVVLNGTWWGLYTVIDHVDEELYAIRGWVPFANVYKAKTGDANFTLLDRFGQPKLSLHQGFKKDSGLPEDGFPGAWDDLDAFVSFVATADPATFAAQFPAMANQAELEDWWMLIAAIRASDSTRKNFYVFHDPSGGQPWRFIPWSYRASFGETWRTIREAADSSWQYDTANGIFAQLNTNPAIAGPMRQRFGARLRAEWDLDVVESLLDGYYPEIRQCALRDERVWQQAYRTYPDWADRTDFNDFEGEYQYVRAWVRDHWSYLRSRF